MKIGNRKIGSGERCFVVAEISGNHNQSFSHAVKLIRSAAQAGADAVKLQTYTPDTITIDSDEKWFQVGKKVGSKSSPKVWKGKTLYQLFQKAYTPWEWQPRLQRVAKRLGLIFFSSVFDESSVAFLQKMHVPCYKVASYEITDIPLLRKIARTKKPVIVSVGFASFEDIQLAVTTLQRNGAKHIALLYCLTDYARKPDISTVNLATMRDLHRRFKTVVGFSDNNAGIEVPIWAAIAGASIIEKHLVLKGTKSPDERFSITPAEFKKMVKEIRRAETALGTPHFGPRTKAEQDYKRSRRSLFVVKNIQKGERFNKSNIRSIRPGFGLHPKLWDWVIGKKAARDIRRGTPLSRNLVA